MKIQVSEETVEHLLENKILVNFCKKFREACENGEEVKFLDSNPDFVQMMLHTAENMDCKIIDDEK